MFFRAVECGMMSSENSLSRNEAIDIILGGLVKFLYDYKYGSNITECEKELFYMAKAANALNGEERMKYTALLGLLAALDPYSRDCKYLESKIAEFIGIDEDALVRAIKLMR